MLFGALVVGCEDEKIVNTYENADYYVSPSGSDSNPGTLEKPFATFPKAVESMVPGDLCYVRGGTYELDNDNRIFIVSTSGTEDNTYKVFAYPGETPILDGTDITEWNVCGIYMFDSSYWHFKGLHIKKCSEYGVCIQGPSTYNIFEDCVAYENVYAGFYDVFHNPTGFPDNNTFLRCVSHHNYDEANHGTHADGFAGWGANTFIDCIAYANSDDGFDWYAGESYSQHGATFIRCISYQNGHNLWGDGDFQGDGSGFKVGGPGNSGSHTFKNCIAWGNTGPGFVTIPSNNTHIFYSCTAYGQVRGESPSAHPLNWLLNDDMSHVVRNCISYLAAEPDIIHAAVDDQYNSWNLGISNPLFASIDPNNVDFLHLDLTSPCIDAGIDVGLPYEGSAPDLGAFEKK